MRTVSTARTAAVAVVMGAVALVGAPVTSASAGTSPRCVTAQLQPTVVDRTAGAGNYGFSLQLTNTGRTCTVRGFGGLGLAGSGRVALSSTQVRTGPAARTVVLQRGQVAAAPVFYANGQGQQGAVKSTYLTVIAPNDRTKRFVRIDAYVFRGRLTGGAYAKSPGHLLRTRLAGVAVRPAPRTTAGMLRRLGPAGTVVSVACSTTVVQSGRATDWYRVVLPRAGWVSASVLGTGTLQRPVHDC